MPIGGCQRADRADARKDYLMKLKTVTIDGKTYAEVDGDRPVYESDDGKMIAFDAVGTRDTISRLNGEAKGHREAKEAAETKLKIFEGIDPAAAKDAISKLSNIDAKKLIDAGEVDKVRDETRKAIEAQYEPIKGELEKLKGELYGEKIGGAFARSKFASEKLAIPADFVQARFGQQFKLEEGKVVAYDQSGNKLYSRAKPGEIADFDEALEMLVDAYPQKDHIMKGTGHQGSGSKGGNGVGNGKTMTRAQFDQLPAADRATAAREMTITD